jgi:hypothetical protein
MRLSVSIQISLMLFYKILINFLIWNPLVSREGEQRGGRDMGGGGQRDQEFSRKFS